MQQIVPGRQLLQPLMQHCLAQTGPQPARRAPGRQAVSTEPGRRHIRCAFRISPASRRILPRPKAKIRQATVAKSDYPTLGNIVSELSRGVL
jgi:hypothetical protein